jgi:hypothetical protein
MKHMREDEQAQPGCSYVTPANYRGRAIVGSFAIASPGSGIAVHARYIAAQARRLQEMFCFTISMVTAKEDGGYWEFI